MPPPTKSDAAKLFLATQQTNLLIVLGKGGGTQCLPLHVDHRLALCAFHAGHVPEPLDPEDVPKVHSLLRFADRTRAVHNFVVREDEFVRQGKGTVVNERGAKGGQDDGVEADEGFNDLEPEAEPDNAEDSTHGKVQEVVAEIVLLVRHSANAGIWIYRPSHNGRMGLMTRSKSDSATE